jgi:hypothetical protein
MATTNYPTSIDNYPQPNNGDTISVADHWLAPAIVAVENELGTDPAGSFTDVKSRLNNLDDRASSYVWSQWNPSASGVQTNAPSTADSSYTSPYIAQSNSSGTLTITFNNAGKYMVFYSMQLNQAAAITFSYCRGTLGGTATRYLTQTDILQTNGTENEENLTVHFLVSATSGQTVTMLPSGRCDHTTSPSNLTFNANISTLFLGA